MWSLLNIEKRLFEKLQRERKKSLKNKKCLLAKYVCLNFE